MSETFIREILSLYAFGGVMTAILLPPWVRWMTRKEIK